MAHRTAVDCDWCGAKDIERIGSSRIGIELAGGEMQTPMGEKLKVDGEVGPFTWIEVCESCAEKAAAAARVWVREEPLFQVRVRLWTPTEKL